MFHSRLMRARDFDKAEPSRKLMHLCSVHKDPKILTTNIRHPGLPRTDLSISHWISTQYPHIPSYRSLLSIVSS